MKRLISSITIICLTAMMAFAAGNTSAEAKKILDKAAAKVNLSKGATANFSISGGKIGNQSGTISIKGNMFQASTATAIVWFDGKTQWTYMKNNDEVNISTPNAAKQASMNPYTFINIYKKGYNLSVENTASGKQVHLTAQNKNASIKEMYVLVDKNYNIKQVKMKQSAGWYSISISNLTSKNLSDSAFTFNAKDYPKAEVIDLR